MLHSDKRKIVIIYPEVKKYEKIIQIIIGNVLMAFAISTLILDNSIVAGGVSGISTVFHFYTGISVSLCVGIINIALFIIGLVF